MTIRPIADKTWLPEDCKEIIARYTVQTVPAYSADSVAHAGRG